MMQTVTGCVPASSPHRDRVPMGRATGVERFRRLAPLLLALAFPGGCAAGAPGSGAGQHAVEEGEASYYSSRFQGHPTASGVPYDEQRLTAAHRTLPFGTRVRVTNLANGHSIVVTITDRGPARPDRVIDVSRKAAHKLGFERAGITRVRVKVVPK